MKRLLICVAVALGLSGCGSADKDGTTSPSEAPVPPNRVVGIGQCLKPSGARHLNVPSDFRHARDVLKRGDLVDLRQQSLAKYVFIWEVRGSQVVHRVYVQSDQPVSVGRARSEALDVIAHPHQEGDVYLAFSDLSPAQTEKIGQVCLGV